MVKKEKPKRKQANIEHIAHQIHVTGVGPRKSKKLYTRKVKHKKKF